MEPPVDCGPSDGSADRCGRWRSFAGLAGVAGYLGLDLRAQISSLRAFARRPQAWCRPTRRSLAAASAALASQCRAQRTGAAAALARCAQARTRTATAPGCVSARECIGESARPSHCALCAKTSVQLTNCTPAESKPRIRASRKLMVCVCAAKFLAAMPAPNSAAPGHTLATQAR